jgi:hypothetical protein
MKSALKEMKAHQAQIIEQNETTMKALEQLKIQTNTVMYGERDLVIDFNGKTLIKYSHALAEYLFTEEELRMNVIAKSAKTDRGTLDQEKVLLIKKAIIAKYSLQGEKLDKAWSQVKSALNQKGRNLKTKWNLRQIFSRNSSDSQANNDNNSNRI